MAKSQINFGELGGGGGYTFVNVSLSSGSSANPTTQTVTSSDLGGKTPKKILYGFIQNNLNYGYAYFYDADVSTTQIQYTSNKTWQNLIIGGSGVTVDFAIQPNGDVVFYNRGSATLVGYAVIITD